jgi:hypothetical protein
LSLEPPSSHAAVTIFARAHVTQSHSPVEGRLRPVAAGPSARAALGPRRSAGKHNFVVMGVSARPGDALDFGAVPRAILDRCERSLLFIAS